MGEHFLAPIDAIDGQQRYVQGVRGKAELADDAAGQVRGGGFDMAFGVLCQQFPLMIQPVEDQAMDTITRIVASLEHTAQNLQQTAGAYRDTEQAISDALAGLLEELGGTPPHPGGGSAVPLDPMPRVVPGGGNDGVVDA